MAEWRIVLDHDPAKCRIERDGEELTDVVSIAVTKELEQPPRIWLTVLAPNVVIEGDMIQLPDKVRRRGA